MIPRFYILQEDEQLLIQTFGKKSVINGPQVYFKPPTSSVLNRRLGISLSAKQFIHIKNILSGEVSMKTGPSFYFLDAHETVDVSGKALPLAVDDYIYVRNSSTGKMKVVCGECSYMLQPHENFLGKTCKATQIDDLTAVIVRNISNGSLKLITESQTFMPADDEEITDVVEKIRLEEHEQMVLIDKDGKYHFYSGKGENSSFFIPPHWKPLTCQWSSGLLKEARNLKISRFDIRPKFMWYEFEVRTKDNVELILKVTFFWQIENISTLVKNTDDAPGDVCAHARSLIIQRVSTVEFSEFLSRFNELVHEAIFGVEDQFYLSRGIKIHSVEAREIACKDQRTQDVLTEIIQETTSRINRIQKQVSQNEVSMKQLEGKLLEEENSMKLTQMKSKRVEEEGRIEGLKQARVISSFLDELGDDLSLSDKIRLYENLNKKEVMQSLANGNTKIFLTHDDLDMKLEIKEP
ncbi:MAG: hypothetical protein COB02_13220 [Candidatus Cloacimonadota bacterium]|nr:MAG: hypothetical protein COB02_13220 [Candidatus Cloacimonadota bacterium]